MMRTILDAYCTFIVNRAPHAASIGLALMTSIGTKARKIALQIAEVHQALLVTAMLIAFFGLLRNGL